MKSSFSVVWLDLEVAKVFHFSDERMERETLHAHRIDHHTHVRENDERDCLPMYDDLAQRLEKTSRVLIVGPGLAKEHFVNRLKTHFPLLARKVVGVEASDHPTDGQIAAFATKYFQKSAS